MEFKNLKLDLDKKECYLNNTLINLTKIEFNLLMFFLTNRNKIYSRKEIMVAVWDKEVSLRAVDTTVSRLRKKLGNIGNHLKTKLGFGYGFNE